MRTWPREGDRRILQRLKIKEPRLMFLNTPRICNKGKVKMKEQCPLLPVRPPEIDGKGVLLQPWLTLHTTSSCREEKDTVKSLDILLMF